MAFPPRQPPPYPNYHPRKSRDWEPSYFVVPMTELSDIIQTTFSRYQGGPKGNPAQGQSDQAVVLLTDMKGRIMALSAQVQSLVDQVAASKSIEASSAASLAQLVSQSADLKAQVAAAVASAGAAGMSAEDSAAIVQAATDLHDSAAALADAAPKNTAPVAPADVIAPVVDAPVAPPA